MFTLFFGGATFASSFKTSWDFRKEDEALLLRLFPQIVLHSDVNLQYYLQAHYCLAMRHLAKALHAARLHGSVVIGYEVMNEPSSGYIGLDNLCKVNDKTWELNLGPSPTPYEGMRLGSGHAQTIDNYHFSWKGPAKKGRIEIDPEGTSAWQNKECLWAKMGVWDAEKGLLAPRFFSHREDGSRYNFMEDFFRPFVGIYAGIVQEIDSSMMIFVCPPPGQKHVSLPDVSNVVDAAHWYDGLTLIRYDLFK